MGSLAHFQAYLFALIHSLNGLRLGHNRSILQGIELMMKFHLAASCVDEVHMLFKIEADSRE